MKVVRKLLTPDELSPANIRYDADCNCIQQTYDGGETWVDNPGADPRHSDTYRIPPIVADDPKCQAAANMTQFTRDTINRFLIATGVAQAATSLLDLWLVAVGPVGWVIDLIIIACEGLFAIGTSAIAIAFSDDIYNQLECIFYNNIGDDGQVSAAQLDTISADISAIGDSVVNDVMAFLLNTWGEIGLSNAGAKGDAAADCGRCQGHCFVLDFTLTDGTDLGVYASGGSGTWESGVGWKGNAAGSDFSNITLVWPFGVTLVCQYIEMTFTKTTGGGVDDVNRFYALNPVIAYNNTVVGSETTNPSGTNVTKLLETSDDELAGLSCDINNGTGGSTLCVASRFVVHYTGDIPDGWSDNC